MAPNTFLMVWATNKFRSANPKTYKAVLAALKEATDSINANKRRAAEIYVQEGGNKENVDKILKMMEDPQVSYTLTPERVLPFAQFMHQVGILKKPAEIVEGSVLSRDPQPAGELTSRAARRGGGPFRWPRRRGGASAALGDQAAQHPVRASPSRRPFEETLS